MAMRVETEILECAARNHAWEPAAMLSVHMSANGSMTLFTVCVRCGSEKAQDIGPDGEIWGNHYYHSERYYRFRCSPESRNTKAAFRVELYRRQQQMKKNAKKNANN